MKYIKDPISALSHFVGVIFSIIALILLVTKAISLGNSVVVFSFTIFGSSLILLYSASTVYHSIKNPEWLSKILQKIDHMMIFVLIAGTYTPICLIALNGTLGSILLSIIWVIAILGIIFKACFMNVPRWFYTGIYLVMGWIIVLAIFPLKNAISNTAFIYLFAGGLFYTLGALIYATKWPKINSKLFGFHEIFHIFVLAGSVAHFYLIYSYIL